jgi:hypothetical protein
MNKTMVTITVPIPCMVPEDPPFNALPSTINNAFWFFFFGLDHMLKIQVIQLVLNVSLG